MKGIVMHTYEWTPSNNVIDPPVAATATIGVGMTAPVVDGTYTVENIDNGKTYSVYVKHGVTESINAN
jgi:hypothetical protein